MEIGIFARTYKNTDIEDVVLQIKEIGIRHMHMNMSCLNESTLPTRIDYPSLDRLKRITEEHSVTMDGMSGTFNILKASEKDYEGFERLAKVTAYLKIPMISLCTGSNGASMWEYHPDNRSEESWKKMKEAIIRLSIIAEKYHLTLGIEPEHSNVVCDAVRAKKLLEELPNAPLGIIMDGANLLPGTDLLKQKETLTEAFALLSSRIIQAHAKDFREGSEFVAAGKGVLDYRTYFDLLKRTSYNGAIILHQLLPEQVQESVDFLNRTNEG